MALDEDFLKSLNAEKSTEKVDLSKQQAVDFSENLQEETEIPPLENELGFVEPVNFEPLDDKADNGIIPPSARTRSAKRDAKIRMTKEEYRKRLEELNLNAETKNYVLLLGKAGAGKSYIISSLVYYMKTYLNGTVRLNQEVATREEVLLYNRIIEMFSSPQKSLDRTSELEFYELNLIYQPQEIGKPPMELTFIDASGEHFARIYEGKGATQAGELPDYLEVILESDVNCKFAFVYDQSIKGKEREQMETDEVFTPQVQMLSSLFDKIRTMQDKYGKFYPKILLLSKADKVSEKTKEKYGHSPSAYAQAKENELISFANGYFREPSNKAIFYQMGTFTKYDDLDKFDHTCPAKLFDWIYNSVTGDTTIVKPSCWEQFKRWAFGGR
ncbi:hypothetical protein EDC44_12225 [Cricetibacter osteomyelitidis]|uniref:Uncharacterized protein n=1 Tax=Cricetibacter osteomyelitidis TaxID=1521931 RepID=A0A4R2SUY7_9PAST|nr:hypothetical protein [Cricetibacter osteomyelitidis]TCP93270.1 hypothetical protein EDC44_12225 [Cricetibacter osteomyelitidis]